MGVSGVGKSTVAAALSKRLGWTWAEGDHFHPATNITKMLAQQALTDADRQPWLHSIAAWIGERERARENAIVACSALKRSYRDLLRAGHPSARFIHLVVPAVTIAERLQGRTGHFMPAALLADQLAALEPLEPDEPGITVEALGSATAVSDEIAQRLP